MKAAGRAVAVIVVFVAVFAVLMMLQPPTHRSPQQVPNMAPGPSFRVTDQVLLSETLSLSAKSMQQTLKYGPVVFRYCPYCFNMSPR